MRSTHFEEGASESTARVKLAKSSSAANKRTKPDRKTSAKKS